MIHFLFFVVCSRPSCRMWYAQQNVANKTHHHAIVSLRTRSQFLCLVIPAIPCSRYHFSDFRLSPYTKCVYDSQEIYQDSAGNFCMSKLVTIREQALIALVDYTALTITAVALYVLTILRCTLFWERIVRFHNPYGPAADAEYVTLTMQVFF